VSRPKKLRVGTPVVVPWGASKSFPGKIVFLWGDPPEHVHIEFWFNGEPRRLMVPVDWVEVA
jgi:hypothetical protein